MVQEVNTTQQEATITITRQQEAATAQEAKAFLLQDHIARQVQVVAVDQVAVAEEDPVAAVDEEDNFYL